MPRVGETIFYSKNFKYIRKKIEKKSIKNSSFVT